MNNSHRYFFWQLLRVMAHPFHFQTNQEVKGKFIQLPYTSRTPGYWNPIWHEFSANALLSISKESIVYLHMHSVSVLQQSIWEIVIAFHKISYSSNFDQWMNSNC